MALQEGPEPSRTKRAGLAAISVLTIWGAWALLWFLSGPLESALDFEVMGPIEWLPLAAQAGLFAVATYFLYALPLVLLCPVSWQLRKWYVVLVVSALWTAGILWFVIRISIFEMGWILISAIVFAIACAVLYLVLLRRTALVNALGSENEAVG